jgi:hypothetical protein
LAELRWQNERYFPGGMNFSDNWRDVMMAMEWKTISATRYGWLEFGKQQGVAVMAAPEGVHYPIDVLEAWMKQ